MGKFSDIIGRKKILILSMFFLIKKVVLYVMSQNFIQYLYVVE